MKYLLILLSLFCIQPSFASKPNIFIISLDSFTRKPDFPKNFNPKLMPNLNNFTETGFLFKNSFTQNSWANMNLWLSKIPNNVYVKSDYDLFGLGWKTHSLRRVLTDKNQDLPLNFFMNLPSDPESFDVGMAYVKNKITHHGSKPFFLELHIKELHPPFYVNDRIDISRLSPKSREILLKYLKHPESYADKVVLFTVLFDESLRLHHSPQVLKAINKLVQKKQLPTSVLQLRFVNLTIMDDMIELWKKSIDYKDDLNLLSELYEQRQVFLDSKLPELFSLFGDIKLAENTLFVVVSNYGFARMEHDLLFDAVSNYDEFIGVNLFVKPPFSGSLKIVQEQSSLKGLGKYIYSILDPKISKAAYISNLSFIYEPEIISANFNHDLFAIRDNNDWKLHLDLVNSKRKLFDLKNDPGEKTDLIQRNPDKAAELETIILKKLSKEGADD